MTQTVAVFTRESDSIAAGRHLGEQILAEMNGEDIDALVVFASARFDYESLLEALEITCKPALMVGSSSAGEFTGGARGEESACAMAIRAPEIQFSVSLGTNVSRDRVDAARQIIAGYEGVTQVEYPHRTALVMSDVLTGYIDELVEQLTLQTGAQYQFVGGGAGDDARFSRTHVFCGTRAYTDAAVSLEILSKKPVGIGVSHGWVPAGDPYRVTEAEGLRLISLNALPVAEVFEEHARKTGQSFDPHKPLPFFLHNILGIQTQSGYRLRVPLSVEEDGSILCAAEVPPGAVVHIMKSSDESAIEAAAAATRSAVDALGAEKPAAALFFDCVATRLRLGDVFGFEIDKVARALGGANLLGCNTYGQIARGTGQFSGFHNCTAVVCVLPT